MRDNFPEALTFSSLTAVRYLHAYRDLISVNHDVGEIV